ncbi:hypothetical protein IEQ34_003345 [Dendrobium chrysotoxum]|uniref:Uncharacterized protein n=1 Tax=Dendrobium chrysotoxum TaxID=161865 RepID=A0AAV7HHE3_DENCH|nr:hypothetical protein IEQ34_003345 [Dendrobium chrysotoxum]
MHFDPVKMGRRKKDGSNLKAGICKGATLREENIGKKEVDVSSILKIKHLQKLAAWAGGEGGIPPLGAFLGYHLAANAEVSGVPLDKSSFFCQRCESNLQPGFNCTIRIEKCKLNKQRRSCKKSNSFQNNVIYKCNFCHRRNSIKGTTKGHVKALISSKESRADPASESKLHCSLNETTAERLQKDDGDPMLKSNSFSIPTNDSTAGDHNDQNTPVTPPKLTVLSKNKRKLSELESEKLQSSSSGRGSSRRKRKTWSNLKDIVERKEAESNQNVSNYVIPLFMQT